MGTARYRVTLRGRLGEWFADAFPGARIEARAHETRLITEPLDRRELDRLLTRVADFGLDWVMIETIG